MLDHLVDTGRYPLTAPGSPAWSRLVDRARHDLGRDGCCVLPGFVPPSRLEDLRREGVAVAPHAHTRVEVVNAYNIAPGTPLPDDHPGRVRMERGNAFVPWDRIPRSSLLHRLYTSPAVQRFVAACVGLPAVHPLADPLAGLCLNVIAPGRAHPWHFDTNEFSVSILTQAAEHGGAFEYCPGIRSPEDERLADVRGVLDGRRPDLVRRLDLRPGDLQLFRGRYSLHRVTTVAGTTARHTAILAYSERPGVVGTPERTRQLFGRLLPEHRAPGGPARSDRLLD
ncbi:MAG TPA: hypothetical protein VIL36_09130 [Acidimicrobiales bacterium]